MDIIKAAERAARLNLYMPYNAENIITTPNGLRAFSITDPDGGVTVVFGGTGSGEWIDNGEGLSGVAENGRYATQQQIEALDWFNITAEKNGWTKMNDITVTGHSKGGNKAQFVTMYSDLVDRCFSFDGQGFSPEAIAEMPDIERSNRIYSFSAYNDYVNVLGVSIVPKEQNYYFDAPMGRGNIIAYHYMEAMLGPDGSFNRQRKKGSIAEYIGSVSDNLMALPPEIRKNVTLGVMNLFQKYIGRGTPVNSDEVSAETTLLGLGTSAILLIGALFE